MFQATCWVPLRNVNIEKIIVPVKIGLQALLEIREMSYFCLPPNDVIVSVVFRPSNGVQISDGGPETLSLRHFGFNIPGFPNPPRWSVPYTSADYRETHAGHFCIILSIEAIDKLGKKQKGSSRTQVVTCSFICPMAHILELHSKSPGKFL